MAGRPTKYTEDMQARADAYVDGGFGGCGDVVPSRAGLALELGVSRSTLAQWEKAYPEFSATLDRLKAAQERLSLNGGLRGELNAPIVKLLLANHGYGDKVTQAHVSPDGSMSPPPRIDASKLTDEQLEALTEALEIPGEEMP